MKNQYVGDVNDYRKYGLIRSLVEGTGLSVAMCWMLTPDDGRSDGKFTSYLSVPDKWQRYDPLLFDGLNDIVNVQKWRNVQAVEAAGLIPSARYFSDVLPDDGTGRDAYFQSFWTKGCDLVFFDPDNGFEVKSKPCGRKGSSKYLYWSELQNTFANGVSILVYQHFPFIKRDLFIRRTVRKIQDCTGAKTVFSFRTARVVFFLVPSPEHRAVFDVGALRVESRWEGQIVVQKYGEV